MIAVEIESGRWFTPDLLGLPAQAGGDTMNPQSLNRYAYALNNPTTLTDPLGLDSIPACGIDSRFHGNDSAQHGSQFRM